MLSFYRQVLSQLRSHIIIQSSSELQECPYCKEKDPDQLVQLGEGSIKCMSCCNIYYNKPQSSPQHYLPTGTGRLVGGTGKGIPEKAR